MVHIILVFPSVAHDMAFSHLARLLDGCRRRKPVYPIGGIGLTGTSLPLWHFNRCHSEDSSVSFNATDGSAKRSKRKRARPRISLPAAM